MEEVEDFLTEKFAKKNVEEIKSQIGNMESIDGKFCQVNLWKLKKRICPKAIDPPMGKRNEDGLLITAPNLLKELYLQTYQKRLRHREMKDSLYDIYFLKEELWSTRMEILRSKKSSPWNMSELKAALKSLKCNKTADPNGMINELFKSDCAGSDLLESLLLLFMESRRLFPFQNS